MDEDRDLEIPEDFDLPEAVLQELKSREEEFDEVVESVLRDIGNNPELAAPPAARRRGPRPRTSCPCLNCVNGTGINEHQCPQCSRTYKRKHKLLVHLDAENGVKRHSCQMCDKKFSRSDMLARHVKTHNKGTRSFSCPQCKYTTDRKYALANHVKIHGPYSKTLTGKRGRPAKRYLQVNANLEQQQRTD